MNQDKINTNAAAAFVFITTFAVVTTVAAAEAAAPAAAFVLISFWFILVSDWFSDCMGDYYAVHVEVHVDTDVEIKNPLHHHEVSQAVPSWPPPRASQAYQSHRPKLLYSAFAKFVVEHKRSSVCPQIKHLSPRALQHSSAWVLQPLKQFRVSDRSTPRHFPFPWLKNQLKNLTGEGAKKLKGQIQGRIQGQIQGLADRVDHDGPIGLKTAPPKQFAGAKPPANFSGDHGRPSRGGPGRTKPPQPKQGLWGAESAIQNERTNKRTKFCSQGRRHIPCKIFQVNLLLKAIYAFPYFRHAPYPLLLSCTSVLTDRHSLTHLFNRGKKNRNENKIQKETKLKQEFVT